MAYRGSTFRGLGIAQMIIGGLMIILAIVSIAVVRNWSSYVGFGFWIGVWVVITGILGYFGACSDNSPNKCLIGTFMGFATTSCFIAAIMFIAYSIALSQFSRTIRNYHEHRYYYDHGHYISHTSLRDYNAAKAGVGVGSCLLILAITEFFVALASSIYCCAALCCGASVQTTTQVQQVSYVVQQPGILAQPGGAGVIIISPTGQATVQNTQPAGPQVQTVMMPGPGQPMPPVYWATPAGAVPSAPGAIVASTPHQQLQYNQAAVEDKPPAYAE